MRAESKVRGVPQSGALMTSWIHLNKSQIIATSVA